MKSFLFIRGTSPYGAVAFVILQGKNHKSLSHMNADQNALCGIFLSVPQQLQSRALNTSALCAESEIPFGMISSGECRISPFRMMGR